MLLLVESSRWCCRHLGPDSTQRAENPAPSLWPRASRPAPVERASPRRGVPMRVGPSSDGRQARSPRWTGGQPAPWSPARHLVVAFLFSPLGREVLVAQGDRVPMSFRSVSLTGNRFAPGSMDFEKDINVINLYFFACTPWSSQHPTMTSGSRMGPSTAPPGAAPCAPAQSTAGAPPDRGSHATPRGAALNSRYNQ